MEMSILAETEMTVESESTKMVNNLFKTLDEINRQQQKVRDLTWEFSKQLHTLHDFLNPVSE